MPLKRIIAIVAALLLLLTMWSIDTRLSRLTKLDVAMMGWIETQCTIDQGTLAVIDRMLLLGDKGVECVAKAFLWLVLVALCVALVVVLYVICCYSSLLW